MKRLAILGASGHGKVIADAALLSGFDDVVFFDDAWPKLAANGRWQVVGDSAQLLSRCREFDGVIVAIGNNSVRASKSIALMDAGAMLTTVVHPSAVISPFAVIGSGSFIAAGAIVQVDATVGRFCIVNTNAVVEHDCALGEAVHISPGAMLAGAVTVGDRSWVGIGACARQLVRIGSDVVVGAGAVVIRSISDSCTVVGNPARPLVR